jgi:glycosyltransferase involved in cell wall biosynthesis
MPETSSFNSLSVVIPTYNREKVLAKALEGYLAQSSPHLIHELLVVDDGSTDGTESMVKEFSGRAAFPIRYLRQANKGPAAARNWGIREARSALILFSDSDIIPEHNLVEQHIAWHRENSQVNAAILGYVTWSPEIKPTPFMRWYGERKLFWFFKLRNKQEASFHFFYTCNISLKIQFLKTSGQFDEEFRSAAYEDTELGYRLSKQGLHLLYNPAAIAYHYQFFSFEDACRKRLGNVAATQIFFRKEAGQQFLKEIQNKQSHPGYALVRGLAVGLAAALSPARRLLDSSLPLPAIVYQLFFWASTEETSWQRLVGDDARYETSS